MTVVTPHELFMALEPDLFPWESRVITDFNQLLPILRGRTKDKDSKQALEEALTAFKVDETQIALV